MKCFRIIARSKDGKEAYAEMIDDCQLLEDDTVWVRSINGSSYFTDLDSIVFNPEIIRRCSSDWLYKIKLKEVE